MSPANIVRAEGFSLFELVVFIICVAILYATAANRFAEFPAEAERANFWAVFTQLQSGINLEMMIGQATGRITAAERFEGANPMDLMLEPPSNYLGAFDIVDRERIRRRTWYFDLAHGELVYLVNASDAVFLVIDDREIPTEELRFKIVSDYREEDSRTGLPIAIAEKNGDEVPARNRRTRLGGVVMRPLVPFRWGAGDAGALLGAAS